MPQPVQPQVAEGLGLQYYLGIVRRRHMHFLIPMFFAWLAVWGASWVLPSRYTSGTLILVEQPTMPKDYVVPNVSENIQERLQSITQQILSRSRLLHIADEMNLYAKDAAGCRRTRLSSGCARRSKSSLCAVPTAGSARLMFAIQPTIR